MDRASRRWVLVICSAACLAMLLAPEVPSARAAPNPVDGCNVDEFRIVLDVGHSLGKPGATSARGRPEFAFNRDLARTVAGSLRQAGFRDVRVFNDDGADVSLNQRVQALNALKPNLLISIHHDSVQPQYLQTWTIDGAEQSFSDKFQGFSVFISRSNAFAEASRQAADWLGTALVNGGLIPSLHHAESIPGEDRPLLNAALGVYAFDGLAVLRGVRAPAALLEAAIIKHRADERVALTPTFRQRVADAVTTTVRTACRQWPAQGAQPAPDATRRQGPIDD